MGVFVFGWSLKVTVLYPNMFADEDCNVLVGGWVKGGSPLSGDCEKEFVVGFSV